MYTPTPEYIRKQFNDAGSLVVRSLIESGQFAQYVSDPIRCALLIEAPETDYVIDRLCDLSGATAVAVWDDPVEAQVPTTAVHRLDGDLLHLCMKTEFQYDRLLDHSVSELLTVVRGEWHLIDLVVRSFLNIGKTLEPLSLALIAAVRERMRVADAYAIATIALVHHRAGNTIERLSVDLEPVERATGAWDAPLEIVRYNGRGLARILDSVRPDGGQGNPMGCVGEASTQVESLRGRYLYIVALEDELCRAMVSDHFHGQKLPDPARDLLTTFGTTDLKAAYAAEIARQEVTQVFLAAPDMRAAALASLAAAVCDVDECAVLRDRALECAALIVDAEWNVISAVAETLLGQHSLSGSEFRMLIP